MAKKEEKENSQKMLEQLQIVEQNLQNLLLQKQMFQLELIETDNALGELKKTKSEDIFKIVGSLMVKSNKVDLTKSLERKKELLNLRIKAIEKQEENLKNKLLETREEVLKELNIRKI